MTYICDSLHFNQQAAASVYTCAEPAASETPSLGAAMLLGSAGSAGCCLLTDTHNPAVSNSHVFYAYIVSSCEQSFVHGQHRSLHTYLLLLILIVGSRSPDARVE